MARETRAHSTLYFVGRRLTAKLVGPASCLAVWLASNTVSEPSSFADESLPIDTSSCLAPGPQTDSLVLIALDGVRWQEIYQGVDPALAELAGLSPERRLRADQIAPTIHALARRGAALGAPGHGEAFRASGPNYVSLPGYTELFTGRPAPCQENDCRRKPDWTIADGIATSTARPVGVFSSWEPIGFVASSESSSAVVSTGRNAGYRLEQLASDAALGPVLERGRASEPSPGKGSYRPDALTAELAVGWFERTKPALLFLSLGDTDEHAHAGDYPGYLDALTRADQTIAELVRIADAWSTEGHRTTFVITTDHGRSVDFMHHGRKYPESARAWLVAAGAGIPERGLSSSPRTRYLRDVAPTLRQLAGLAPDDATDAGAPLDELLTPCGAGLPPRSRGSW